ncbi:MAG: glycosyltransferase family 1 protein [Desulfurivibrionaceae bacterium]
MNILVNARPLTSVLTGIARYVRNLYTCLEKEQAVRIGYFNGREAVAAMPAQNSGATSTLSRERLRRQPGGVVCAARIAHWLWFEHCLRREICRGSGYNIYHETGFFPSNTGGRLPVVHTVYDLSLRRHAHTHPRERVCFYEFFIKRRLAQAAHILTISNFVREEIMDEFHLPPGMVSAVHLAPDPHFFPRSAADQEETRRRLALPAAYFLFVGTLEPRKNLGLLIEALAICRHDLPVVLAGWSGWGEKDWLEKLRRLGLERRVILAGHVGEEDLARLYSGAVAMVYPSLYEGFGLPILEAMACGCPVVCSNSSCLPETAGDAALLVDPREPEELAAVLDKLVENDMLQQEMSERGYKRAAMFTWEQTARQTLDVFAIAGG